MSIQARLLFLVFAVWLPAVAGFALLARTTYLREADAARLRVEQLGYSVGTAVERELDKRVLMAQALAGSSALQHDDLATFHAEASAAAKVAASWVFIVTRSAQTLTTLAPFDASRPVVSRAEGIFITGGPEVHFTMRGPFVQKPVLGAFAAVPGKDQTKYNVGLAFYPSLIESVLAAHNFPTGASAAVINDQQIIMARNRDPERWLGRSATGLVKKNASERRSGFIETVNLDKVSSLTYVSPPSRYGWNVVIAMPMATLTQAAQRVTMQAVTAAALLLLAGLGMALYAARRISRPILNLRDAASELARDDVPPRLSTGVKEADEVSAALRAAGIASQEAKGLLEKRVAQAVQDAAEAQTRLLEGQKHEALGRLTGGLAHDLNNLLQSISVSLQLLKRAKPEGAQLRALEGGSRACAKAAELVRQMQAFSRPTSLAPVAVPLSDLLLKTQELASKALSSQIEMTATLAPNLPPLFVDPAQLEIALLNLIFNARDAMPHGGTVEIAGELATSTEMRSLGSGVFVRLRVTDTGAGMNAEVLKKATEPYFTTKPMGAGSGLGLAQVHSFVRQSGGTLQLQSVVGKGTTITLVLPTTVARSAAMEVSRPAVAAAPSRPLNVLMVEDDVLVGSVVVPALEAAGHRVELCMTADDACRVLSGTTPFDVLFTDVVMPGSMTGIDLVAWTRRTRPTLPAVVATGYTDQHMDEDLAVLRKPYEIDALLSALDAVTTAPG